MMFPKTPFVAIALLLAGVQGQEVADGVDNAATFAKCRCVPGDKCWPSDAQWKSFDDRLGGRLIKNHPIAESCYDGPHKNPSQCAYVDKMWPDQDFQTENPIGRPLPYNITCPPVEAGQSPTRCLMGQSPTYAVNVTTRRHIADTLAFAQRNNIRLTVASTGHDMLGRSDGYGSLEIWLRYYRHNITFQPQFVSASACTPAKANWTGNAIRIDGAWQWRDVHVIAKKNNVVVVSGGSISPGATGGWPSGGGHGPATRTYGLGADQILEADVMLADGRVVTANACENTDLYRALRGGGPGYGVVLGTTIKAHPNVKTVQVNRLTIAPKKTTPKNAQLLDAVAVVLQSIPQLNNAGYAGYGNWYRNSKTVLYFNATSGYRHNFWIMDKSLDEAKAAFAPLQKALAKFEDDLIVDIQYASYTDYWSFYDKELGLYDPAGITWAMSSRLFDRPALENAAGVREYVEVTSGKPEEYVGNSVLVVSGGQVFKDAADKNSGLHPAWRTSPLLIVTFRNPEKTISNADRQALNHDMTFVKGGAGKKLAPNTGGYMNEGDVNDPEFQATFYGANYKSHLAVKNKYDPKRVFYCRSCVGSESFVDNPDGALCRV